MQRGERPHPRPVCQVRARPVAFDWLVSVAMIHSASHNLSSALTTAAKPAMDHRL